jgi:hypothetical protein
MSSLKTKIEQNFLLSNSRLAVLQSTTYDADPDPTSNNDADPTSNNDADPTAGPQFFRHRSKAGYRC